MSRDPFKELDSLWRLSNKGGEVMQFSDSAMLSLGLSFLHLMSKSNIYEVFLLESFYIFVKKKCFSGEVDNMSKTSYPMCFNDFISDSRIGGTNESTKATIVRFSIV